MGKLIRNGIEYGGGNGTDIFEVTQAQYDALKQAGTLVHNALYVISDAPNLNPTASDIDYQSGVTVADKLDDLKAVATSGDYDDLLNKPITYGGTLTDLNNSSRTPQTCTLYTFAGGATNSPSGTAGGWLLSMINEGTTNYGSQLALTNGGLYFRKFSGASFQAWTTLAT